MNPSVKWFWNCGDKLCVGRIRSTVAARRIGSPVAEPVAPGEDFSESFFSAVLCPFDGYCILFEMSGDASASLKGKHGSWYAPRVPSCSGKFSCVHSGRPTQWHDKSELCAERCLWQCGIRCFRLASRV